MDEHAFSKKDCARRSTHLGPYRATKLWNDLIHAFRNGMPVGRHWRHMKSHDDCFSASEATTWLLSHLQSNPNFGPNVTRSQTVLLLEKFYKNRIFEDVRQNKQNREEFTDGGRLFRFVRESPVKGRTPVRVPLSTRSAVMNSASSPEIHKAGKLSSKEKSRSFDKLSKSMKKKESKNSNSSTEEKGESPREIAKLTALEVENTWKGMVLARLKSVLSLPNLDDTLNASGVNVRYLIHNMTQVNKNGIVTNIDKKDQLPQWVLSAMKCLAYWPVKVEDLPYYDGFDKDVFIVVKDYFLSLEEPLTTFDMYDVFTNVMATLEEQNDFEMRPPPPVFVPVGSSTSGISPASLNSYTSLENLMADLTMNAQASLVADARDVMIVHDPDTVGDLSNMPDLVRTHSRKMSKYSSASSLRSAKLETSFGVNDDEPQTHVVMLPNGPPPPAPIMSLTYGYGGVGTPGSGMVTPGSLSSNQSASRAGGSLRASMMSDRSYPDSAQRATSNSRASVRSAGGASNTSSRYQSHYSQYSDRSHHAVSISSSVPTNDDNVFLTSPEYNMSYHSHHDSASQGPRTCPEQGSYTKVTNSCVNLLNNFVAQSQSQAGGGHPLPQQQPPSLPSYMPPPRYDSSGNNTRNYPLTSANISVNSAAHRSSANTSTSSYDTACSHLSNNVSVGNASNTRESAGSLGYDGMASSTERKQRRLSPAPQLQEFGRQPSRCSQRESPVFAEPQVMPKLQQQQQSGHSRHLPANHQPPQAAPAMQALQESYRMAMETDRNMPTMTPIGRSLFGRAVRKSESSPNLHQFSSPPPKNRTLEALQICTLMLPPANRRKLHLLLRLMHKMVNNMELRLDGARSTRALVLDTFSRCILRSPEEVDFNEMMCVQVVAFMMDHYTDLMAVPSDLKSRIEDRIIQLRRTKTNGLEDEPDEGLLPLTTTGGGVGQPLTLTSSSSSSSQFCERVSLQAYETQRLSSSQSALSDLLDDILRDRDMGTKEKKKRLKQFQKHHPEIYTRRFPSNQSEAELFPNKPKIKPPLLARPLHKLRSLRL